jgi:hypothetical protein
MSLAFSGRVSGTAYTRSSHSISVMVRSASIPHNMDQKARKVNRRGYVERCWLRDWGETAPLKPKNGLNGPPRPGPGQSSGGWRFTTRMPFALSFVRVIFGGLLGVSFFPFLWNAIICVGFRIADSPCY